MHHWTTADDQTLTDLHRTGRSLTSIARDMHRGKATISEKAKALGLTWNRAQVGEAVHAKITDAKARRANALLAELEILELSQARVLSALRGHDTWSTVLRGDGGAESERTLDTVPPRDLRDETTARASMAVVISRLDDNDHGATEARSMLERLAARLNVTGPTP